MTVEERSWIGDVADADFEREVLERSERTPVVVDFWSPGCAPCRVLGPLLERLADEHRGAFFLARVNADDAPATAARCGVRALPTVVGIRDRGPVAEFVGAQPERAVRQFLSLVLPTEADRLALEGLELAASGRADEAEAKYRAALELDARHARALDGLARALAERGEIEEALALLERMPADAPLTAQAERFAAELRTRAEGGGDEAALRARIEGNSDDLEARLELGRALAAEGRYEEALAELMAVVERDAQFGDEGARRAMVDVFSVLGSDHALTVRFRSQLARALYR